MNTFANQIAFTSTPKFPSKKREKMEQVTEKTIVTETETKSDTNAADIAISGSYYSVRSVRSLPPHQSSYNAMFKSGIGYSRNRSIGYSSARMSSSSFSQSFEEIPVLLSSRNEEKQQLGLLNNRFVNYIEKVHKLEARNQYLEAQITKLEKNKFTFSRSADMYESQLVNLQSEIETINHEKAELQIELHNCLQDIAKLENKLSKCEEDKADADSELKSLRRDVDMATLARVDLERKVENLQEDLQLTKMTSEEDIRALQDQLAAYSENEAVVAEYQGTDLSATLAEIRDAYEKLVRARKVDVDAVYREKMDGLVTKLDASNKQVSAAKADSMDFKRQLHTCTLELESLRTSNSSMEVRMTDVEAQHQAEIDSYNKKIVELETVVGNLRDQLAKSMVDYNDLMNTKLSLSIEIETYRKLLEGEDGRLQIDSINRGANWESTTDRKQAVKVIEYIQEKTRSGSSSSASSSSTSSEDSN